MKTSAMNIGVHVSSVRVFTFSRYMPRSGVIGRYGSSIFRYLRKLHTVLHSGCNSIYFYRQSRRFPFSPHPLQHLKFIDVFVIASLTDVR